MSAKVALAEALGFIVLLPACLFHRWTSPPTYPSIKPVLYPGEQPSRPLVDEWKWEWLNEWYANSEDGVSGQQAWVWIPNPDLPGHLILVPYASTFPRWVPEWAIAYAWSAWRNGANNLKRPVEQPAPLNIPWHRP